MYTKGAGHQRVPADSNYRGNGPASMVSNLNPIEHAWDMLQTAISARSVQPIKFQQLQQALLY